MPERNVEGDIFMVRKIAIALIAAAFAVAPVLAVAATPTPTETTGPASGAAKSTKSSKKAS